MSPRPSLLLLLLTPLLGLAASERTVSLTVTADGQPVDTAVALLETGEVLAADSPGSFSSPALNGSADWTFDFLPCFDESHLSGTWFLTIGDDPTPSNFLEFGAGGTLADHAFFGDDGGSFAVACDGSFSITAEAIGGGSDGPYTVTITGQLGLDNSTVPVHFPDFALDGHLTPVSDAAIAAAAGSYSGTFERTTTPTETRNILFDADAAGGVTVTAGDAGAATGRLVHDGEFFVLQIDSAEASDWRWTKAYGSVLAINDSLIGVFELDSPNDTDGTCDILPTIPLANQ